MVLEYVDLMLRGAAIFGGYFMGALLVFPRMFRLGGPECGSLVKVWITLAVIVFTAYIALSAPIFFDTLASRFGNEGLLFGLSSPPYFELFVVLGAWMYWVYFFNAELEIRLYTGAAFTLYVVLELLPLFTTAPILHSIGYDIGVALAMAGYVTALTLYAFADDLVPTGRVLRLLIVMLTAIGLYTSYLALPEEMARPDWAYLVQSVGFVILSGFGIGFCIYMNNARLGIFQEEQVEPDTKIAREGVAQNVEPRVLKKLTKLMDQELWREEGLTIAKLAAQMGEPEYLIRRTINMGLGHKNFPQYLNGFRIQAAQVLLNDPENDHMSIATMAYSLGFGSAASFARAFKGAVGHNPAEYRRDLRANLNLQS